MSTFPLPTTPWIPVFEGLAIEIPPYIGQMAIMYPPPKSPNTEDAAWTSASIKLLLDLAPNYRAELWEPFLEIWRLKETQEEAQCATWKRLMRAWMVRRIFIVGSFA